MLACSFDLSANLVGLICALGSTIVFVSQNIFIKKLHFQESSATEDTSLSNGHVSVKGMFKAPQEKEKLDKLNILFYSSGMAFLLMIPIWFFHEGGMILWQYFFAGPTVFINPSSSLTLSFIFNGTVHFGQNIIAFSLLSVASPVAYSIAGLVKRIFVIVMSIIWFGQPTTLVQALGYAFLSPARLTNRIIMTFLGLYMYDRAKMEVARGERRVDRLEFKEKHLLPLDTSDLSLLPHKNTGSTSATEKSEEFPRRRSSSLSDTRVSNVSYHSRGLGSILEANPTVTPNVMSPPPVAAKVLRNEKVSVQNGHRRRYSQLNGSVDNHWNRDNKVSLERESIM